MYILVPKNIFCLNSATEQVGVKDAEKGAGDSGSVCDTDETAPPASPTPLPPPATPSDIAPLSRPRTGRGSRHSKLVRQTSTFMMAAQLVGSHGASAAPCGTPAASRQLQAKLLCEHEQVRLTPLMMFTLPCLVTGSVAMSQD